MRKDGARCAAGRTGGQVVLDHGYVRGAGGEVVLSQLLARGGGEIREPGKPLRISRKDRPVAARILNAGTDVAPVGTRVHADRRTGRRR